MQRKSTRGRRGFLQTSTLLEGRIRVASETRGFGESRLLTHWAEIVGDEVAALARPVKISYAQRGIGATLTVLTTGAQAPMLEMRLPQIRARVNECYGYNAISRVRLTQTAPTGFAEGQAEFTPAPRRTPAQARPSPEAQAMAEDVGDPGLRHALSQLGANVLSKNSSQRRGHS